MINKQEKVFIICTNCNNKILYQSDVDFDQQNLFIKNLNKQQTSEIFCVQKKSHKYNILCKNCEKLLGEINNQNLITLYRECLVIKLCQLNPELEQDYQKLYLYSQKKILTQQNVLNNKYESQIRSYAKKVNSLINLQRKIEEKRQKIIQIINQRNLV